MVIVCIVRINTFIFMIQRLISKFLKLYRNQSVMLFMASIMGVGFGLVSSILNTNFLDPVEYGNYRYVYNIITFISSLLLFGYFVSGSRLLAINNDVYVRRRINGAMVVILMGTILITIALMIPLYYIHAKCINVSVAHLFLWSIPVAGAPLVLNYINTTFQGENRISGLCIARLLPYVLYLPLGYFIYSYYGASDVKLMLLQNGCAMVIYAYLILSLRPSFSHLSEIFRQLNNENKFYGKHVYVGSVLAVSLGYLSGITLGVFEESNVNVGFYTLALTIATPLSILPTIVGTTHFKEFATQNSISSSIFRNTILISLISLVSFIIMVVPLVRWVYSESYSIVGYYACILAFGTTLHGFGDMINRFLGAHGKGKEIRNSAVATGLLQTTGSIVLVYIGGIYGALITKVLSSCLYLLLMIFYYRKNFIYCRIKSDI